jgi:hypothetical protein
MVDPFLRDDLSRFVVHLTRDTDDGESALDHLVSILATKRIEARTAYCLFQHDFKRLEFADCLQNAFRTVCLTETPLSQINKLTNPDIERKIKLAPYGLVFLKDFVLERNGNPAVFINAHGDDTVKRMLLDEFRFRFKSVTTLRQFNRKYTTSGDARIRYYSLINVIQNNHNFTWEREWRHLGNLRFKYENLIAIICPSRFKLRTLAKKKMTTDRFNFLPRIPIINADWGLEDIVEEMWKKVWHG